MQIAQVGSRGGHASARTRPWRGARLFLLTTKHHREGYLTTHAALCTVHTHEACIQCGGYRHRGPMARMDRGAEKHLFGSGDGMKEGGGATRVVRNTFPGSGDNVWGR